MIGGVAGRLLVVLAGVAGLVALTAGAGFLLPRDHVARMSMTLAAPPDRVWLLVSDVTAAAAWRDEVRKVERLSAPGAPLRFAETSDHGTIPFEMVSQEPPRRQVVRILDDGLPFGGTWTWTLEPAGAGTRITIEEAGFIRNPIFRVMGRLVFPPTDTMDGYLRDMARALGESAAPRVERER